MEGVGSRLGRSSTRYGPATVFSGPVRKWKKKWVPLASPASTNNSTSTGNGNGNGNGSHLLVYKWTPTSSSQSKDSNAAASTPPPEEPPKRKFRYVPVSVIEDQKQEIGVKSDDEAKPNESDQPSLPAQTGCSEAKPDMNDVAMDEAPASDKDQDPTDETKETNLDLSLGLKAHDGDSNSDTKISERSAGDVDMAPAANAESENRLKRKVVVPDLEMRM